MSVGGIIPDPPARRGNRCAVCRRKLPDAAIANDDPFCRTECAKSWHTEERRATYWWAYTWVKARAAERTHERLGGGEGSRPPMP